MGAAPTLAHEVQPNAVGEPFGHVGAAPTSIANTPSNYVKPSRNQRKQAAKQERLNALIRETQQRIAAGQSLADGGPFGHVGAAPTSNTPS